MRDDISLLSDTIAAGMKNLNSDSWSLFRLTFSHVANVEDL